MSGAAFCFSKISAVMSISRENCSRMSVNLVTICRLMAPSLLMDLKFCRRSKAPSADRSFLNDLSMNSRVARSIASLSCLNLAITCCQSPWFCLSKASYGRVSIASIMLATSAITLSMPCASPVTVLSSGPRNLWKSSETSTNWRRSWHTPAMYSVRSKSFLRSNSQRASRPLFSIFSRTCRYCFCHCLSVFSEMSILRTASCRLMENIFLMSMSCCTRLAISCPMRSKSEPMRWSSE
mmetsp:Transcript_46019/g.147055  ORF Transcript_46019/g.147055 Transcript_46019/m.147055 type:complete len:238 (-) Transcript_46019:905-1618(-)